MKDLSKLLSALNYEPGATLTDGQTKLLYDYFADPVDGDTEHTLISRLLAKYAEISYRFEEQNRLLTISEAKRREAEEIALLGSWEFDIESQTTSWSDTMYPILEYPPDTAPSSEAFMKKLHPDDLDTFTRFSDGQRGVGGQGSTRCRLLMDDGRVKWAQMRYITLYNSDGQPFSFHGTFQDITDTVIIEEQLKPNSEQLERQNRQLALSDAKRRKAEEIAMLVGNWSYDIEKRIITWSDTIYPIFEYSSDVDPSSAAIREKVHPDDQDEFPRLMDTMLREGGHGSARFRLLMDDGRVKWVQMRYNTVKEGDGQPVFVHGTFQDITESVLAEMQLKSYNESLEILVNDKVKEISASQIATIQALVKLAETRDDDTGSHIERTSQFCRLIAEKLMLAGLYSDIIDEEYVENIAMASPLHDIGKVGIPDAILLKPGRLNSAEFEVMKRHVRIGYETLSSVAKMYPENMFLTLGMEISRYHHEKWNGSGYTGGLAGDKIPLSARIMALSDMYDALRTKRVYKGAYSHKKAIGIIIGEKGTHFDPVIVDVFLRHHERFNAIYNGLTTKE